MSDQPNNATEVTALIRRTLERLGEVPAYAAHKKKYLFKGTGNFTVRFNEILRLLAENPDGFYWLVWPKTNDNALTDSFFVIPHAVAARLLPEAPVSVPAGPANPSLVRSAGCNVNFRRDNNGVSALVGPNGRRVDISEYENDFSSFNEFIFPHWALLDEKVGRAVLDPPKTTCRRCGKDSIPSQLGLDFDVQCSRQVCHLWYRGAGHPEDERGDFVFVNKVWIRWDGRKLD